MLLQDIEDVANFRWQTAAIASIPGSISLQNILGTMSLVDDQGVATAIGGGLSPIADQRILGNVSGVSANPAALTAAQVRTMLSVQDSSAVSITGGTIAGVGITTSTLNLGGNSLYGNTTAAGNLTLASTSNGTLGYIKTGGGLFTIDDLHGYIKIGAAGTVSITAAIEIANPQSAIELSQAGTAIQYINRTVGTGAAGMGFTTAGNASGFVFYPGNTTKALEMLIAGGVIKVGFFAAAVVAQQTVGANVNNVAASGTTGQFDDFTNGVTYATDYAALHATVYQLTRSVAQLTVAMRNFGLGA